MEDLQISKVQINFVQASPNPCGASLSDPKMQILFNIAASTGGTVYFANSDFAGASLLSIPTTYYKSYVYQNFAPDCSNGSTFYFPVDSETQTIQVQIFGDLNGDITYRSPDGQTKANENWWINTIYNDVGSNARFDEILRPCDAAGGWREFGQLCWWFDTERKTWEDAYNTCNGMGAILPMITSQAQEATYYFNIDNFTAWIGLNDQANLGQWVWALRNGDTISVGSFMNTYWSPKR